MQEQTSLELRAAELRRLLGGRLEPDARAAAPEPARRMTLPTINAAAATAVPRKIPAVAPTIPSPRSILLVDDDEDSARVLARLLTSTGYAVTVADSCASALQAGEAGFDLLLGDIALPDGSGLDLVAALKQRRAIKAIALTGFGGDDDVAASLAAGYDAHLTKPITLQQLEQTIDRLYAPRTD